MNDEREAQGSDWELESEIRQGRKFTAQEAIARIAGPGAMKGGSPVSRQQQAETEIGIWLGSNVAENTGALKCVLQRHLNGSEVLLNNLDQPLVALADQVRRILASDDMLKEIVRESDVEWGRMMDEKPYFEREGSPPHGDDPYTLASVQGALSGALEKLR